MARKHVIRSRLPSRKAMLATVELNRLGVVLARKLHRRELYAVMTVYGFSWSVKKQEWSRGEPLLEGVSREDPALP